MAVSPLYQTCIAGDSYNRCRVQSAGSSARILSVSPGHSTCCMTLDRFLNLLVLVQWGFLIKFSERLALVSEEAELVHLDTTTRKSWPNQHRTHVLTPGQKSLDLLLNLIAPQFCPFKIGHKSWFVPHCASIRIQRDNMWNILILMLITILMVPY